jgi:L-arabinose isomerase
MPRLPQKSEPVRPRVAVISVYFTLFDEQMPSDFRHRQEAFADELRNALSSEVCVVWSSGLLASDEEGKRAYQAIKNARPDVLVFASTMAAPPSYVLAALGEMTVPVVLWTSPRSEELGADLDQATAHEDTTMLGALMLANVLLRRRQPYAAVTARVGDEVAMDRLFRTVRGFAAASRLRGSTALAIGEPYPGYLNVQTDDSAYPALGIRRKRVSVGDLTAAYDGVQEARVEEERDRVARYSWEGRADERSLRLAAALRGLVDSHDAICGTINCHGVCVRANARIGIPACLAVSLSTVDGVPFSCTGDLPAAIAVAVCKAIAGAALYCEFYTPELATNTVLLANGGEGDTGLAADQVEVGPSTHYPGMNGAGSALAFALRPGPMTIASLAQIGKGWRLVWALGEVRESRYPRMRAPNGMFAFASPCALDKWIASGATHHHALAPGHLDVELPFAAEALGIESWRV